MKIEINIDDKLIESIKLFFKRRTLISAFVILFVMSIVFIHAADIELVVFQPDTPIKSSEINENFSKLRDLINLSTPIGTVTAFAGKLEKIPAGWLLCDGSAVNRTTYAALFEVTDISWGAGDGTTTFNLPDLRGRFLRGVDGDAGIDADKTLRSAYNNGNSGNAVGSYQGDAIRNITGSSYGGTVNSYGSPSGALGGSFTFIGGGFDDHSTDPYTMIVFDASRVVPTGSDNRPKNAYVYYLIKAL